MSLKTSPTIFCGWPAITMQRCDTTLVLTPQVGGRIISLQYRGQELFFTDPQCHGHVYQEQQLPQTALAKTQFGFKLWGGHKTWVAPQSSWLAQIPPLDLDAGQYQISLEGQKAIMVSAVCRETGLRVRRCVTLHEGDCIEIEESFLNASKEERTCGIWSVAQLLKPCAIFCAFETGGLRSYHHTDPTLPAIDEKWQRYGAWVKVDCQDQQVFKCGGISSGRAAYVKPVDDQHSIMLMCSFESNPLMPFAHGSNVEVFNSPDHPYAELEVHSPCQTLLPGEELLLKQTWRLSMVLDCLSGLQ